MLCSVHTAAQEPSSPLFPPPPPRNFLPEARFLPGAAAFPPPLRRPQQEGSGHSPGPPARPQSGERHPQRLHTGRIAEDSNPFLHYSPRGSGHARDTHAAPAARVAPGSPAPLMSPQPRGRYPPGPGPAHLPGSLALRFQNCRPLSAAITELRRAGPGGQPDSGPTGPAGPAAQRRSAEKGALPPHTQAASPLPTRGPWRRHLG